MTEAAPRKSDHGVRVVSAVVMVAVAGTALWLGGVWWKLFVAAIALACLSEFFRMVVKATSNGAVRAAALISGAVYICIAAFLLAEFDTEKALLVIGLVVFTDIGAYFAGRSIGGPRIAPRISPSKTWAGLGGGMIAAALWAGSAIYVFASLSDSARPTSHILPFAISGALLAIVAQAGDFLESWLKRRAGMKDSSKLIPGHGGVLDRVDGLLSVTIVTGMMLIFVT